MRKIILTMVLVLVGCSNPTGSTFGYQTGQWHGLDWRLHQVNAVISRGGMDFGISQINFTFAADSESSDFITYQSIVPIRCGTFRFDTLTIYGLPVSISADYDGERWNGVHVVEQPCGFVDSIGFYMEYGQ